MQLCVRKLGLIQGTKLTSASEGKQQQPIPLEANLGVLK